MDIKAHKTDHFEAYFEVTFQGRLNDAHWFYWEHDISTITICHDTDEDIIKFCEEDLVDSVDVWIDGDRTQCNLKVEKCAFSEGKRVLVELPIWCEDEWQYPYDTEEEVEVG